MFTRVEKFIPVHRLAIKLKIRPQEIYRAIREHKLEEYKDYAKVQITVERIQVRSNLKVKDLK